MFRLQPHQERVLTYLNHVRRLLLYHGLGSGKTCTSIALAVANQQPDKRIVVITPASLVSNYQDELRGSCGNHVRAPFDRFWIVSKDKMYHDYKDRINVLCQELKNTVIVIDEVHRLLSYTDGKQNRFFQKILDRVGESSACVFLSATPITDPYKLVPLARFLLTPREFKRSSLADVRTSKKFFDRYSFQNTIRQEKELVDIFKNRVSYFEISQRPRVIEEDVECYMEGCTEQSRVYREAMGHDEEEEEGRRGGRTTTRITQEFLLTARQASNLVVRREGEEEEAITEVGRARERLKARGIKFHTCLESVTDRKGPFFVYSNFVTESGVNAFAEYLERLYRYSDVVHPRRPVVPYRSFAVLRNDDNRSAILARFNSVANRDGREINIVIGSPSSAEGITLKKLREIHILDPHWMPTTTDQIIARGVRFQSHAQVNYNLVRVFHYYAVPRDPSLLSVDLHLKHLQLDKRRWLDMFTAVLKHAAIEQQPSTSRGGPAVITLNNNTNNNNKNKNNNNNTTTHSTSSTNDTSNNNAPHPVRPRNRRIRRITQLHPFNPRLLNKFSKRRLRKKTVINLTDNNTTIVNLT